MQCKRRYAHLTIIVTAYAFLILAGRWAFFTEVSDRFIAFLNMHSCEHKHVKYGVVLTYTGKS